MKEAAISQSPHVFDPLRELTVEERKARYRTRIDESFKPYTVFDILQKVYHRNFEDDENDKQALRWCIAKPDKRKSRKMTCPKFTDLLYETMGWDKGCRYKILGFRIERDGKTYYVFDLNVYKIFKEKPKDGEEGEMAEPVDTRKGYYPADIANTFGVSLEEHKQTQEMTIGSSFVPMAQLTEKSDA